MKINKKPNTIIDSNSNNNSLQNNQKKDNLKNLNQRIKNSKNIYSRGFFKDLVIVENVGIIHKLHKRTMFKKGSAVLKKSGEIIEFKSECTITSTVSSSRLYLNALTLPDNANKDINIDDNNQFIVNIPKFNNKSTNLKDVLGSPRQSVNKAFTSSYFTQSKHNAVFNKMGKGNFKVIENRDCIAEY